MASVWIRTRPTKDDGKRYRVEYRLGGRESRSHYGGSFRTMRDAKTRRDWIAGELAALRAPDLARRRDRALPPTLADAAQRWQESRVDVAEATRLQHRTALRKALPALGKRRLNAITAQDLADLVARLDAEGAKRESIRKVVNAVAMVLDHAGVVPNPARDRVRIRLPREQRPENAPPAAKHVLAVHGLLPSRYRLPLLVLNATGMRLGKLERLTWGDVDEPRGRWRVSQAVSKTGRGRWVQAPPAPSRLCPSSCPATIALPIGVCSRGSVAIASARQSRARAQPQAYRRSHLMSCGTSVSRWHAPSARAWAGGGMGCASSG